MNFTKIMEKNSGYPEILSFLKIFILNRDSAKLENKKIFFHSVYIFLREIANYVMLSLEFYTPLTWPQTLCVIISHMWWRDISLMFFRERNFRKNWVYLKYAALIVHKNLPRTMYRWNGRNIWDKKLMHAEFTARHILIYPLSDNICIHSSFSIYILTQVLI